MALVTDNNLLPRAGYKILGAVWNAASEKPAAAGFLFILILYVTIAAPVCGV